MPVFLFLMYMVVFPGGLVCSFGGIFCQSHLFRNNLLPVERLRAEYQSLHLNANPVWTVLVCWLWNRRRLITVLRSNQGPWHSIVSLLRTIHAQPAPLATQGAMTYMMLFFMKLIFITDAGGLAFKLVKNSTEKG